MTGAVEGLRSNQFLLGETVGFNLLVGIVAVAIGIWIASTDWKGLQEVGHDG